MKKLLLLAVALTLAVTLCACDFLENSVSGKINNNSKENTTVPTPTSTEAAEPEKALWILPDSDRRYMGSQDLKALSVRELVLARNEIFARRGYAFSDPELTAYFSAQSWYVPSGTEETFSTDVFNAYETGNLDMIKLYERRANGITFSEGNPYAQYYREDRPYMIATSDTTALVETDYMGMTPEEASLARNEIMARHGYTFTDAHILEYFLHQSWYFPDTQPGKSDMITLSPVEQGNADILREYQTEKEASAYTYQVTCDLFSVTTPAYWEEVGLAEPTWNGIRFREKIGHEAGYGGHVFSLYVYRTMDDYEMLPDYDLLGYLTDSNGVTWHLVAMYPTDVQFDLEDSDMYYKMQEDVEDILCTVIPAQGCTYRPI